MDQDTLRQLDLIFSPRSVAVIGASDSYEKWGFQVYSAISESYASRAPVYAVNTAAERVHGERAYPRVTDVPGPVDLAAITVPAAHTSSVIKDCVSKGVKVAVVITGGFAEVGAEGAAVQAEIVRIAREGGMRIVGPNIMGHLSTRSGLISTPFIHNVIKGKISLASQSGNIAVQFLQNGQNEGIGFSKFVGTGNEADLSVEDFLEYYAQDQDTGVIALYIEGLKYGRRLFEVARRTTRRKPIVAMKAGVSEAGARAARSHSAALAGSDSVYEAAFRQCGIVRATSVFDLLHTAAALSYLPVPHGKRVGIVTIGGGIGVVVADFCHKLGLEVSRLSPGTIERIGGLLPPFWSRENPVDIVGNSRATSGCVSALLEDKNVDAVLCVSTPGLRQVLPSRVARIPPDLRQQTLERLEEDVEAALRDLDAIIALMEKTAKPVIFCKGNPIEERFNPKFFQRMNEYGFLVYPGYEDAARSLANLARYGDYLAAGAGPACRPPTGQPAREPPSSGAATLPRTH